MRYFIQCPPGNAIASKASSLPIRFAWCETDIVLIYELAFDKETFDQVVYMRSGYAIIFKNKGFTLREDCPDLADVSCAGSHLVWIRVG